MSFPRFSAPVAGEGSTPAKRRRNAEDRKRLLPQTLRIGRRDQPNVTVDTDDAVP